MSLVKVKKMFRFTEYVSMYINISVIYSGLVKLSLVL